ncbi:ATP synthase F0 subunit A [Candidatus Peregrinibacteria bacterium CG08_land_8_20_14_0_20_41_10]|nr:MAG: ATP synthase F0 subunit A [Candidatus Peregrinibacteria bacterium CG1_02_41_10]PIS32373.1 MAG: ATP synthase F0 subunit A [Candidatus Peregrinibacteria bacterium CG08_land_8_20_14_0_20_41_10]
MEIVLAPEKIAHLGGLTITNTLTASCLVVAVLIFGALLVRRTGYSLESRFYNLIEMLVETFLTVIESVTHNKTVTRYFLPIIGTFFLFIVFNNWFGIFPGMGSIGFWEEHEGKKILVPFLRSANSDLNMTLAVALASVAFTQVAGIRFLSLRKFIKKYFNLKNPILFFVGLLEVISEIVKIFSFSFRLFGNIFAGEVLMIVILGLVPFLAPLPFMGIEMFAGFIQALVFAMLTLVFTSTNLAGEH